MAVGSNLYRAFPVRAKDAQPVRIAPTPRRTAQRQNQSEKKKRQGSNVQSRNHENVEHSGLLVIHRIHPIDEAAISEQHGAQNPGYARR